MDMDNLDDVPDEELMHYHLENLSNLLTPIKPLIMLRSEN